MEEQFARLWDAEMEGNRFRRRLQAFVVDEEDLSSIAHWIPPPLQDDASPVLAFVRSADGKHSFAYLSSPQLSSPHRRLDTSASVSLR